MNEHVLDLQKIDFWALAVAAVVFLAPWTRAAPRKWIFASLNIVFVVVLLRWHALGVASALFVAFVLLQLVGRRIPRLFAATVLALLALGLFLVHKLPAPAESLGLSRLGQVLSFIGFSYVALRLVEVLRAVLEGRHAPPDFPSLVNYLLPFHMLAAGPIQSYEEFVGQPSVPKLATPDAVLAGLERIASGVFKKFVLAYCLQKLFLTDFQARGLFFVLELQVFYVWLFLDFSAYTDIAVGVGALIGVETPENFNRPLRARNLIDFWERWHMSLSQFIRRNLFIPIQTALMRRTDARRPLLCAIAAVAVSFLLCGAWHGLTLPFLCWGAFHAVGLVLTYTYGYVLKRTLSANALKAYRANPCIRACATVATFEFAACSLAILFFF
jgi:D-alanyl-lipoteichoic acid acyltransferase DltB (MBOAT superfamily)